MAPLGALINPLALILGLSTTMTVVVVGAGAVVVLGAVGVFWMRWRRRLAITALGQQRGLGELSAAFLGRLFAGDGLDAAETMLAAPELLRGRLARELRRRHRVESAQEYAERAAHLLEELNSITPPFPGAPTPFQQIALQDAADPNSEIVTAWVLSIDERNLSIISRDECEWPMRRELLATPPAGHGEPFRASLLLRPVPPRHEWVLTHDLVDVITNRRAAVRVSCCLHTHVLPDSGDTVLLRERLADQETVAADELRRLHGWAQRHGGTVLDVSSDGCRLELEHEVALRDRFHVLFVAPDDRLAGMPLAEVVDLRRAPAGRVTAGVRFIGMRLKERTRLAEFVRSLAAAQAQTQPLMPSPPAAAATAAATSAAPEPVAVPRGEAADVSEAERTSEVVAQADTFDTIDTGAAEEPGAPVASDDSNDVDELHAASASSGANDIGDDGDSDAPDDEGDDAPSDAASDADQRRRVMERLGLSPKADTTRNAAPPSPSPPATTREDADPFEYRPRFTSPFAAPERAESPPEHPGVPDAPKSGRFDSRSTSESVESDEAEDENRL